MPTQDRETLNDINKYVEALINYREQRDKQPIQKEELPEDTEIVDEGPKGSITIKYRTCGDESCQCMSGGEKHCPYRYRIYRKDGAMKKEYLGKATASEAQ